MFSCFQRTFLLVFEHQCLKTCSLIWEHFVRIKCSQWEHFQGFLGSQFHKWEQWKCKWCSQFMQYYFEYEPRSKAPIALWNLAIWNYLIIDQNVWYLCSKWAHSMFFPYAKWHVLHTYNMKSGWLVFIA